MAIGIAEAEMMKKNKLIQNEGDTINGFFGNDIIVKKILPETGTLLDEMHFIPAGIAIITTSRLSRKVSKKTGDIRKQK